MVYGLTHRSLFGVSPGSVAESSEYGHGEVILKHLPFWMPLDTEAKTGAAIATYCLDLAVWCSCFDAQIRCESIDPLGMERIDLR